MNSNEKTNQFGQGSKIDKTQEDNNKQYSPRNPKTNDDDFLSGDNRIKYHPNLDQYETSVEDEDRYNHGSSEHEDDIVNRRDNEVIDRHNDEVRYSSPSRNGSHRNHN